MITYEYFKELFLQKMVGLLAPPMELSVSSVLKNNDVCLDSVSILNPAISNRVTPVVYLQSYFAEFKKGVSMEEIVNRVYELLSPCAEQAMFNLQSLGNFDEARDKITLAVVNLELNQERLDNIVHRPWLDLAIIYKYNVQSDDDLQGTITITNQLMKMWNISEEELYQVAEANTRKSDWLIMPMIEMMKKMISETKIELDEGLLDVNSSMYVVSIASQVNGSMAILYPEIFRKIIEDYSIECDGLYILPSSLHELIVLPAKHNGVSTDYLKSMVCEVNTTSLERPEVLSYSVYYYDPNTSQVGIVD